MPENLSNIECFQHFCCTPNEFNPDIISGALKHAQKIVDGKEPSPKRPVFIDLFNKFTKQKIKDYVYKRMKKSLLEELALAVFKELAAGGAERFKTLELVIEKTTEGGKQLVISQDDDFPVSPSDEEILRNIDGIEVTLKDTSGKSPNVKINCSEKSRNQRLAKAKAKKSLSDLFAKVKK